MADELSKISAEIKTSVSTKTEVSPDASIQESSDASEFVDKLPSEAGEKSSEDSAVVSSGGQAAKDDKSATLIGELEPQEFPPRHIMKKQVRVALLKQEDELMAEAGKYRRHGNFHNLNIALQKIREIRFILADLAKATYEALKNFWMKYVQNERKV